MQCNMFSFKYCCEWGIFFKFISCFVFKFGLFSYILFHLYVTHKSKHFDAHTFKCDTYHIYLFFCECAFRRLLFYIIFLCVCCFWFEISYCSIHTYIYLYIQFFAFFVFILRTTSYLLLADLLFSTVSDGDPPCLRCRQHRFVPFTSLEFLFFFKFCFSRLFR